MLESKEGLNEKDKLQIMIQLADGLKYMHN